MHSQIRTDKHFFNTQIIYMFSNLYLLLYTKYFVHKIIVNLVYYQYHVC